MRYQLANNNSVFLLYSGSINKPQFIIDDSSSFLLYQVNNHFITHQLEMGLGKTINGYTFTLAPNYNYQLYSMPGTMEYEAYRTKLNIAKLYNKHALNLTIDYGIGKIIDRAKSFQSTRFLLNYRTGAFISTAWLVLTRLMYMMLLWPRTITTLEIMPLLQAII
ncbi:hypothetical protein LWM68_31720 [Niabella sp. W65]|nr:hypothetical protein [Niabella sp. W65]MCH7366934.1 hypothetical protein [Niabella sp. W65]ULT42627.1 hypothetical protein KRR40_03260 [Niabella sp. I65]